VPSLLFVSIGDEEKLHLFLEKNPKISREQIFVDSYNFDAYKAAGFGRFDDESNKDNAKEAMSNMVAPDLGWKGWFDYLSVTAKVAPIPKDMKFGEIPEGVLRLGGTFVVNGNDILYSWSDRVPGDHPSIQNVFSIAQEAAAVTKNKNPVEKIFSNLFNF